MAIVVSNSISFYLSAAIYPLGMPSEVCPNVRESPSLVYCAAHGFMPLSRSSPTWPPAGNAVCPEWP